MSNQERNYLDDFMAEMENESTPAEEITTTPTAPVIEETQPEQPQEPEAIIESDSESDIAEDEEKPNSPTESTENEQISLTDDDDFDAAFKKCAKQSQERIVGNLAAKNPIFKYASASDEITDKEITFEDLRKKYETDFPELEDGKSVSWTVSYGKSVESISNPTKEKVFAVKAKIEKSEKFIADLKKAKNDKDKNPECVVKPFVKAQKKGEGLSMPDYKGFYMNYDEALKSKKVISFVPARDGSIYEIRKNSIGLFQSPAKAVGGFADIQTKFELRLPKIPMFLLYQVISFFREISRKHKLEVLVHLVYDAKSEKYNVVVPKQKVTQVSVKAETEEYPEHIIHVMDIHSHNVMAAKFSSIDDSDEKATRLYGVIGKLDKIMPEIALRASNGGKFIELGAEEIFDFKATYPDEWYDNLNHNMAEAICEAELNTGVAIA